LTVSSSAAIKLIQRVRAAGNAAPARFDGHRRPLVAPYEANLRGLVDATPDITVAELRCRFGLVAALSTIHNALRRLGLRRKGNL
jgi:transposase